MLEASLKDYDVQLDIAHDSDQDGDFDVVGSSPVKLIITETSSQFTFDQDTDEWFIATYKSGSVGETHVLEVSNIDDVDGITVKRYDGNVVAENKKVADTFDVGELIFVVNGYSETTMSVNLSGISVTNNLIITEEGLQIELPGGYMDNFDVTNLTITEGDSDGNIGVGERTEMFMWFNTDVEVTVGVVHQSFQEIEDTDVFEAFSTSARWLWDKSADQYDLEIEYPYGETTNETPEPQVSTTIDEIKTNSSAYKQVIGSTAVEDNIAAIDLAGFLGIDETIDDLTASINAYEIVIGGPCINRVAAELLGLPYPSCEAASTIPENKGIIKTFTNNGKKQILVAGWEALDTRIAAQAVVRYQEFYSEMNDSEVITFGSSLDDVNIGEEETSYTIRIEIGRDGLDNPIVTLVNDDTSYVICEDKTDREICYLAPYQSPVCGNSITESGEECDDGNTVNGDGCSNDCIDESINGCQSVTFDEKTYYLDPCLLETTMIDGQGDKNFNIIIRQVGNASSYGFSTPGYGEGFPGYAIMGVSGGAYGDQTIPMYFNDGVLNANGSNPMFYTGYQPVNVYHGSATGWNQHELRFYIDLTVNPS
jgi:cysteine-rich repeat protein